MSAPDRQQLVSDIAADMASNWWRLAEGRAHIAVVLSRLDELGYDLHRRDDGEVAGRD